MSSSPDSSPKNLENSATLHTPESSLRDAVSNPGQPSQNTAGVHLTTPVDFEDVDDSGLDEDGYTKNDGVRVLRRGEKVNTEHNKVKIREELPLPANSTRIGRKTPHPRSESIHSLRKKVGFSWERIGRKLLLTGIVFGVIFVVGASIAGAYLLDVWNQTQEVDLSSTPKQSSLVYASNGDLLFEYYGEERREVVPYEQIPRHMQLAIIALEDRNYYYNETGIPWSNIAGAAVKCVFGDGADCRGGSGLSQQYIKNITDEREVTIQRKIRELFTALRLNNEKNKEEIIALYLNQVPFGNNAYGVQQASKTYFNKPIEDTTVEEACVLASLPQKPSAFAGAIQREVNEAGTGGELYEEVIFKKDECLRRMQEERLEGPNTEPFIASEAELIELQEKPIEFNLRSDVSPYPHFEDYVTRELARLGINERGLYSQGYRITTTIDRDIQAMAEAAVSENYGFAVDSQGANNASVVVLDGPTGEIKAMVGSIDYNATEGPRGKPVDGQVNITTSPQQPGSSIKPYVYLTDFLQGFNPGTMLLDGQMNFGTDAQPFEPRNFSGTFAGPVSIRSSLQSSLNIPAVKGAFLAAGETDPDNANTVPEVANNIGTAGKDQVIETAKRLGVEFSFEDNCFLSVAIGGCEVTQLSHTTGINTIAQEGNLRTATPFVSIIDANTGEDVYRRIQESDAPAYRQVDQVIDGRYARQLNNVMSDSEARYPAFCGSSRRCPLAAKLDLIDQGWDGEFKVAAKTGTTDDIRDAWTVGYSPYYTTTVWVGNTDNSQMFGTANSADSAGTIWKDLMIRLHDGRDKVGFSREGLEEISINPQTGLLGDGGVELVTAEQRQELEDARDRLNNPEYNPSRNTIFQNRSTVISRNLAINTVDGLLAVEGRTLPQFIERRNFLQIVPEFPVGDWEVVAEFYNRRFGGAPTQRSNQDQVGEADRKPRITTNVVSGAQAPGNIVLQAQTTGDSDKSIVRTEIIINGETVASNDQGQVLFNTIGYQGGRFSVRLRAEDSFGSVTERTFENVEFGQNEEPESPAGVTLESPQSTSISNPTITLRATSTADLNPAPTLILTQGVVRRECSAQKNGNVYSCQINTSGYIPTVDDESRARIEFLDNSDQDLTTSARTINLTL